MGGIQGVPPLARGQRTEEEETRGHLPLSPSLRLYVSPLTFYLLICISWNRINEKDYSATDPTPHPTSFNYIRSLASGRPSQDSGGVGSCLPDSAAVACHFWTNLPPPATAAPFADNPLSHSLPPLSPFVTLLLVLLRLTANRVSNCCFSMWCDWTKFEHWQKIQMPKWGVDVANSHNITTYLPLPSQRFLQHAWAMHVGMTLCSLWSSWYPGILSSSLMFSAFLSVIS